MKRIITIDNGNTNPHVGIFIDEKLEKVIPLNDYTPEQDDLILISNVGKSIAIKPTIDLKKFRVKNHLFHMPIHYTETLGEDRLFTSFSLFLKIKPNERILLLDAGTFLTADLITEKGLMGGYIFPGKKTFLKSYANGKQLPEVLDLKINDDLPQSTEEAISMAYELYWESILEKLIKKISPSRIFLTGGDGQILESNIKKISSTFPLEFDPHLVHQALLETYLHSVNLKSH